ncbi:hypothetical protein R3I94_020654 [Phoxinus phoxinus]
MSAIKLCLHRTQIRIQNFTHHFVVSHIKCRDTSN